MLMQIWDLWRAYDEVPLHLLAADNMATASFKHEMYTRLICAICKKC
jgi:hypothetical protein